MRTKQVLSWILTLAMCLSMFSIPAMADGVTPPATAEPEITVAQFKTSTQGALKGTVTFEAVNFEDEYYTISVYQDTVTKDGSTKTAEAGYTTDFTWDDGTITGSLDIDTSYANTMQQDLSTWFLAIKLQGKAVKYAPLTVDTSLEIIPVPNNYDDVAVPDENRAFSLGTLMQTDGELVMITVPFVSEEPLMATKISDGYYLWAAIGIPQNNYTYKLAAFDSDEKAIEAIDGEGADEWVSNFKKSAETIGGVNYDIINPNWTPDLLKDGYHFYLLVMSDNKAQYLIKFDYTKLKLATVTFDTNGADEGGDQTYMLHGDTELVRAGTLVAEAPVLESTDNAVFKGWYLQKDDPAQTTQEIVVDAEGKLVKGDQADETQDATYTPGATYYPKWVKQYDVKITVEDDQNNKISGATVTLGDVTLDAVQGKPGVYATSAKVEEGKYALTVSKTLYGTHTDAEFDVGDKNYSTDDDAVIKTVTLTPVKYTVDASLANGADDIASVYGASGALGDYRLSGPDATNTYKVTGTANYIQMDEFFGEKKEDDESGTYTSGYYLALHFPQPKDTERKTFTNGYMVKIGEAERPWADAFDEMRNGEKVLEIVKHIYNKQNADDKTYKVSFYLTEESYKAEKPDLTYTVDWSDVTFGGLKISNVTVDWDATNNKYVATAENLPNGISLKLEDNVVSIEDKPGESEVKFADTNDLTIVKGKKVSDKITAISLDERVSDTAVKIKFTAATETIDAPSIVYNDDGTLSLKTDIAGAEIYYTTNGDEVDLENGVVFDGDQTQYTKKTHGLWKYEGEEIKITQGNVSTIKAVVKLGNLTSEQLEFNKPVFGTDENAKTEYDSGTGKLPVWISNYANYAEHLNGKFYFGYQYQKDYTVETSTLRGGMDLTFAKNTMKIPAGVNMVQIWIFDAPVDVDDVMEVNAHIVDTYTWPTKTPLEAG